jgi:hypothetical protein
MQSFCFLRRRDSNNKKNDINFKIQQGKAKDLLQITGGIDKLENKRKTGEMLAHPSKIYHH